MVKTRIKIILGIIVLLIVLVMIRLGLEWQKHKDIKDEIARLQNEAEALEGRNLEILELSRELTTEEFMEREARLRLGMQKPGEKVLVVGNTGELRSRDIEVKAPGASRRANAKRWWYYFFDHEKFAELKALRNPSKLN